MNSVRNSSRNEPLGFGFTLVELLIVISVIGVLMAALGVTIANFVEKAREAQTIATLRKIDGLLIERQKGLERAYKSPEFRRFIEARKRYLESVGIFGLSNQAIESAARKDFLRQFFPQRFREMEDIRNPSSLTSDGIPDRIQFDEIYKTVTWTGTAPNQLPTNHTPETESSELLYFALTRLEVFGTPLIGEGEFKSQEIRDTDNDGLPEFVDGWGRPLRFYRWPTRLIKPYGLVGPDGQPGNAGADDNGIAAADDIGELGWPGTDDVTIPDKVRFLAGLYVQGLPRKPLVAGQYDLLNQDSDDPYGLLLSEVARLSATGIDLTSNMCEARYHTLDTYHKPLVVSAGANGFLGLMEPNQNEDANFNGRLDPGEDTIANGRMDVGFLAQPLNEDINSNGILDSGEDQNGNGELDTIAAPNAALDDLSNRNRRAGG